MWYSWVAISHGRSDHWSAAKGYLQKVHDFGGIKLLWMPFGNRVTGMLGLIPVTQMYGCSEFNLSWREWNTQRQIPSIPPPPSPKKRNKKKLQEMSTSYNCNYSGIICGSGWDKKKTKSGKTQRMRMCMVWQPNYPRTHVFNKLLIQAEQFGNKDKLSRLLCYFISCDVWLTSYLSPLSQFDADKNGHITASEIGVLMKALGEDVPGYKIRDMIREVDLDENGTVEFNEFLEVGWSANSGCRQCYKRH